MSDTNGTAPTNRIHDARSQDVPLTNVEVELVKDLVHNAYVSREAWMKQFLDPRRNYYDECGYPRPGTETDWDFYDLYRRDSVAARVVEVMPKESWQTQPEVYESEDDETTPFEDAWDELVQSLRGKESQFKGPEGNPVWHYLSLVDVLSGIGSYGVLLLGFDDAKTDDDLRNEVKRGGKRKLHSLRAFPSVFAEVTEWDSSPASPRRGMPLRYQITFNDPKDSQSGMTAPSTSTVTVHWTRIVHVCDRYHQAVSSEWSAAPRMRPVLNEILGDQKITMTSPEAFWRSCINLLMLETHPTMGGDVKVNPDRLKTMMERIFGGMDRFGTLIGMSAKSVAPTVNDPTAHHTVQLERIALKLGMPVRILKGSERGELASSQDDGAWNDRLKQRQTQHITPCIIIPFVDRLQEYGVLPPCGDEDGYSVYWPDLESSTKAEKADISLKRVQALAAAIGGNVQALTGETHLLTTVLGYEDREAESMLKEAAEVKEMQQEEELAKQEEMIDRGLQADPALQQQADIQTAQAKAEQAPKFPPE